MSYVSFRGTLTILSLGLACTPLAELGGPDGPNFSGLVSPCSGRDPDICTDVEAESMDRLQGDSNCNQDQDIISIQSDDAASGGRLVVNTCGNGTGIEITNSPPASQVRVRYAAGTGGTISYYIGDDDIPAGRIVFRGTGAWTGLYGQVSEDVFIGEGQTFKIAMEDAEDSAMNFDVIGFVNERIIEFGIKDGELFHIQNPAFQRHELCVDDACGDGELRSNYLGNGESYFVRNIVGDVNDLSEFTISAKLEPRGDEQQCLVPPSSSEDDEIEVDWSDGIKNVEFDSNCSTLGDD